MPTQPIPDKWLEHQPIIVFEEPFDSSKFVALTIADQGGANPQRLAKIKHFHLVFQSSASVYLVRTRAHDVSLWLSLVAFKDTGWVDRHPFQLDSHWPTVSPEIGLVCWGILQFAMDWYNLQGCIPFQ